VLCSVPESDTHVALRATIPRRGHEADEHHLDAEVVLNVNLERYGRLARQGRHDGRRVSLAYRCNLELWV
jgi:hypothetical protein